MKKGALNFLGRKNQSLFDTNRPIQVEEMGNGLSENVDLALDSSAIPDTGTAKVRSRPTVKHHISTSDSVHGFAVPTPTVPLFHMFNGLKSDSDGDQLSIGSATSVEGDISVPPPPSVAPPPPPTQFVLPPPDFMGELDSPTLAMLQRPAMPPPKPPSQPPALQDLTLLKPPPMTPPKPPSTCSSASTQISTSLASMVPDLPECPTFAPPKPPSEKQQKSGKVPPPKPTRLSSISGIDGFIPPNSAPASHQMTTPSSFNPQNTAKLNYAPKTSVLSGHGDSDTRPKQILLLQDSNPAVQLDGKASPTTPSKPLRGTAPGTQLDREPKGNLQANVPSKAAQLQPKSESKPSPKPPALPVLQEKSPPPPLPQVSPKFKRETFSPRLSEVEKSPRQKGQFSPLIDRKLQSMKGPETSRDGPSASPLALLKAAKEREKHRSSGFHENGPKSYVKHINSPPHSFVITPRSNSISSRSSTQGREEDSQPAVNASRPTSTRQTEALHLAPPSVRSPLAPSTPAQSTAATSASLSRLAAEKQDVRQAPPSLDHGKSTASPPDPPMTLLPPPPEFANFGYDNSIDAPPDFPPPDPPAKKAPLPTLKPVSSAAVPAPPPKPKTATTPPSQAPVQVVKPQVSFQTLPKVPVPKPLPVSESQATLLSILQKKMQEMDSKISPKREMDSSSDEWGPHMSDEDTKIPFAPRTTPQHYKSNTLPAKTATLDMRELETKVAKIQQDGSSASSNGTHSKHGMTFTVRPGTKQPITIVSKGEPS